MTDRASRMYERWEKHSEGLCPKCGEGDTAMAQEVSHIWQRWDTRPHKLTTDGEEMLLIKTKCSECDWEGYAMHEVSPFAGYITEEEIEQHSAMVDARDEAVTQATINGELCWLHESPDCKDEQCNNPQPKSSPSSFKAPNAQSLFARLGALLTSWEEEEE